VWPCDAIQLADEVERLRKELEWIRSRDETEVTENLQNEIARLTTALEKIKIGPPSAMFQSHYRVICWMQNTARVAIAGEGEK
jgi:phage host-nuclease inhibitor protein Gam